MTQTKHCPDCSQTKPLDQFYHHARTSTQRGTYCKPCAYERGHQSYLRQNPNAKRIGHGVVVRGDGLLKCCACQKRFPPSSFYRDRTRSSGYGSRCKPCDNQRAEDRRETRKQRIFTA